MIQVGVNNSMGYSSIVPVDFDTDMICKITQASGTQEYIIITSCIH